MPYKVVLTFESADEILESFHSYESFRAVLSYGAVSDAVQARFFFPVAQYAVKFGSILYTNAVDVTSKRKLLKTIKPANVKLTSTFMCL